MSVPSFNKKRIFVYVSSPVSSSPGGGGERLLDFFTDQFPEAEHVFVGSSKAVYELFYRKGYRAFLGCAGFEPVTPLHIMLFPVSCVMGAMQYLRFRHIFKEADIVISPTASCEIFFLMPWLRHLGKKCLHMILSNKIPTAFTKTPLGKLLAHHWRQDTVVFCSDTLREECVALGLAPPKSLTIHNSVVVHPFALRQAAPVAKGAVHFGFLARLHREKGLDVLLKAFSLIKSANVKIRISIGGDGPHKGELLSLASTLKFPENVSLEWLGLVTDPIAFYESLDALVFPSRREGFSLALLEAWERGVPVIASDIPSFCEAKRYAPELERQLMFRKDDPSDLARCLEHFLAHRALFQEPHYRAALHRTVEEHFGLGNAIMAYRNAMDRVLCNNEPSTKEEK